MKLEAIMKQSLMILLLIGLAFARPTSADEPRPGNPDARDLMPVTRLEAPAHPPVELVRGGQARAVIWLADTNTTPNLKRLLGELAEVVKLSTGAELPIVQTRPAAGQPAIVIGAGEETRAAGIDAAALPVEGFEVKTAPHRVYLVGSTVKVPLNNALGPFLSDGTAWAVADFLERFVGVRWYWPAELGGRTIMRTEDLTVPPAHYRDAPVFRKRVHHPGHYLAPSSVKAPARSNVPSMLSYLREARGKSEIMDMRQVLACLRSGNSWPCNIQVHQPQGVPDRTPEWVMEHGPIGAVGEDGSRSTQMLCYSAPGTFDMIFGEASAAWESATNGRPPWASEICMSISPGDSPVECRCAACLKLWDRQWGREPKFPSGQASRIMGTFVRKVSEEVKRRWPGKRVVHLPYWNYAFCPEDIDFPDNVVIEMATTGFPAFRQAAVRQEIERNMHAWSRKVGGRITTWEYSCWLTGLTPAPLQYPHLLQDYYRTNRAFLAGSFINGGIFDEWSKTAPSLYCWLRVLWNPEVDIDATLDEMCNRLYGKGGKTARELLRLMCDRWEKAPWSEALTSSGGHQFPLTIFTETWPPEVVAEMERLWRQAREELKDDPVALQRFNYWNWTFENFLKEAKDVERRRRN